MNAWALDGLGFLLLILGIWMGQPKFLRALCVLAFLYLLLFSGLYYLWLGWKFHEFKTHPAVIHVGVSAAFVFEGFWKLFANMLLLQGVMPVAVVFMVYFAIKWLAAPMRRGTSF